MEKGDAQEEEPLKTAKTIDYERPDNRTTTTNNKPFWKEGKQVS